MIPDDWPRTAEGGRLFTDNEPMDMFESDGVTWEDVRAIEAEARREALREAREAVAGTPGETHITPGGNYTWVSLSHVLSRLDALMGGSPK